MIEYKTIKQALEQLNKCCFTDEVGNQLEKNTAYMYLLNRSKIEEVLLHLKEEIHTEEAYISYSNMSEEGGEYINVYADRAELYAVPMYGGEPSLLGTYDHINDALIAYYDICF